MSDVEGAFQSLLGSIKSHFAERLKSPFGGAFVISWLAINWKPVLILAASNVPIEARIDQVSKTYFSSSWEYLWTPLLCATGGVLAFYMLSTVFLIFYELYSVLRNFVERRFDGYTWVPPTTYIEAKRSTQKKIEELTILASDQLKRVEELRAEAAAAESLRVAAEVKADEAAKAASMASGIAEIQASLAKSLQDDLEKVTESIDAQSERFAKLSEAAKNIESASRLVEAQLDKLLQDTSSPLLDKGRRRPLNFLIESRSKLAEILSEMNESAPVESQSLT